MSTNTYEQMVINLKTELVIMQREISMTDNMQDVSKTSLVDKVDLHVN